MEDIEKFDRFDLTDADNLRVKMPRQIRLDVEEEFYDFIKYKTGITIKDAFLYCAQMGIEEYKKDTADFYRYLTVIDEEEKSRKTLMLLPRDISNGLDHLRDGLHMNNKRQAFLTAIYIALKIMKDRK